jgi:hypothetical protein
MSLPRPPVSAAAATSAAMLFVLLLRPVYDVDIFWQLRLGELELDRGTLIRTEPFAASHLGEPLVPVGWLGQVVYALARRAGGWPALRALDALVWVGGFWAVAAAARRSGAAGPAVLVALGVGFMSALPCASLRPQSFAALGFGLALAVCRRNPSPARGLAVLAVVFVLWQNLHPSVGLAAITFGATAGVAWVRWLAGHRPRPPWLFTGGAALAALAVFATPAGAGILPVTAYNAEMSVRLGVNEWLPPWDRSNYPAGLTFAVAALAAGWLVTRNWRRVDLEEAAPAAALFVLTLTAHRFALFWGIAIVPVLARCLTTNPSAAERRWGSAVFAAVLVLAVIGFAGLVRPTWFHDSLPLEGVTRLRATGVRGTVFCHYPYGGPLIDAGFPDWVVTFDGRYYRYTPEEWELYAAAVRGEVGVEEIERRYRPDAFFLRPGVDAKLIRRLEADPGWRRVYEDRTSCAFVRAGPPE